MNNLTPRARKLATFHLKNRNPTAAVCYDAKTQVLTLANGERVDLNNYGDCDAALPTDFGQACGWWSAIKAGRPVPVLARHKQVEHEIITLLVGFSPRAKELLLLAAKEIENEEWIAHWRAQSARMGKLTH